MWAKTGLVIGALLSLASMLPVLLFLIYILLWTFELRDDPLMSLVHFAIWLVVLSGSLLLFRYSAQTYSRMEAKK